MAFGRKSFLRLYSLISHRLCRYWVISSKVPHSIKSRPIEVSSFALCDAFTASFVYFRHCPSFPTRKAESGRVRISSTITRFALMEGVVILFSGLKSLS